MSELKPASDLDLSRAGASSLRIDCSVEVMEQIRAAALAGVRQMSRGGLEIGGMLLGEHRDNEIRILSWKPIICEHARGPAFLLSDKDRTDLGKLLLSGNESSSTRSHPVGWFVSHSKSGGTITESDLEIFQQFFPERWQTMLVLNPGRNGKAEGTFFIRDEDGQIRAATDPTFSASPIQRAQATPLDTRRTGPSEPPQSVRSATEPQPIIKTITSDTSFGLSTQSGRRRWMWLIPALLGVIVASTLYYRSAGGSQGGSKPASLGLRATDEGGVLRVQWDRNSETIRQATRASLEIRDGSAPIALDANGLQRGFVDYSRKSSDLELRMTIFPASGVPRQETTKFLGPPPQQRTSAAEIADLKAEVEQLRERNRQLEKTIQSTAPRAHGKNARPRKRR